MSVSYPSPGAIIAEVPRASFLGASFVYNFFTVDESQNEDGSAPSQYLQRPAEFFASPQVVNIEARIPRFVRLLFKPAQDVESQFLPPVNDGRLISDNFSKIVPVEKFVEDGYFGVSFEPTQFDDKIYHYVSSSAATLHSSPSLLHSLGDTSLHLAVRRLFETLPSSSPVPTSFLEMALVNFKKEGALAAPNSSELSSLRMQLDSRFAFPIAMTAASDPYTTFGEDIQTLLQALVPVKQTAVAKSNATRILANEYDPPTPSIDVTFGDESTLQKQQSARIVGYVIDKWEQTPSGLIQKDPIIIERSSLTQFDDIHVKFGSQYAYSARTIARIQYVSLFEVTPGNVTPALVTVLISSKPTARKFVTTVEYVAPPPPRDLDFRWDYVRSKLTLFWSLPVNTQRDIKKIQIFRRPDLDSPFELISLYDFDDSYVKYPDPENENVPSEIVTNLDTHLGFYVDESFARGSSFVYTLATVDAHGLTSPYAQQYRITFDKITNSLKRELIASSGAPKQHPNYTLIADLFQETIVENKDAVSIAFSPDCYSYVTEGGARVDLVDPDNSFFMQVLNVDNQKQRSVRFNVVDMRSQIMLDAAKHDLGSTVSRFRSHSRLLAN